MRDTEAVVRRIIKRKCTERAGRVVAVKIGKRSGRKNTDAGISILTKSVGKNLGNIALVMQGGSQKNDDTRESTAAIGTGDDHY